ncbi:MAG: hypothetical protein IJ640_09820 [Prevotella sp.]|nr:hypothetical protein [Prevotella sp.]
MSFFYTTEEKTDRYGHTYTNTRVHVGRIVVASVLVLFLLVTVLSSFTIIPSGYTGVRTTFGQIDNSVVPNGFALKIPYIQHIQKVNNKQQEITFKDTIWGESSERTVVYMADVVVTYRINSEYSAWLYANVTDYKQNALPQTLVASAMKASMVSLEAASVTNRSRIEPLAIQNLQDAIDRKYGGERVITIVNVNINNMDFEDSYNNAIAAKQVAQLEFERKQIENETAINVANAEAEQKRIAAQAEADKQVIAAQAEASAILAVADAQADANRKLANSLTDALIEYEKIKAWDGQLPTVTGGSGTLVGIDIE